MASDGVGYGVFLASSTYYVSKASRGLPLLSLVRKADAVQLHTLEFVMLLDISNLHAQKLLAVFF